MSPVDQGNYTCRPATGGEASISLHVLEGDDKDDNGDDDWDDFVDFKTLMRITSSLNILLFLWRSIW